jgi:hypothetical protein
VKSIPVVFQSPNGRHLIRKLAGSAVFARRSYEGLHEKTRLALRPRPAIDRVAEDWKLSAKGLLFCSGLYYTERSPLIAIEYRAIGRDEVRVSDQAREYVVSLFDFASAGALFDIATVSMATDREFALHWSEETRNASIDSLLEDICREMLRSVDDGEAQRLEALFRYSGECVRGLHRLGYEGSLRSIAPFMGLEAVWPSVGERILAFFPSSHAGYALTALEPCDVLFVSQEPRAHSGP